MNSYSYLDAEYMEQVLFYIIFVDNALPLTQTIDGGAVQRWRLYYSHGWQEIYGLYPKIWCHDVIQIVAHCHR